MLSEQTNLNRVCELCFKLVQVCGGIIQCEMEDSYVEFHLSENPIQLTEDYNKTLHIHGKFSLEELYECISTWNVDSLGVDDLVLYSTEKSVVSLIRQPKNYSKDCLEWIIKFSRIGIQAEFILILSDERILRGNYSGLTVKKEDLQTLILMNEGLTWPVLQGVLNGEVPSKYQINFQQE